MIFVRLVERRALSPLRWPRGKMKLGVESGITRRIDIANFAVT